MQLTHLTLDEFRVYDHLELALPLEGLRIVGRNASGKTSLLEAIVMLATTRSPRTSLDREAVRWESGEIYGVDPYARLQASVVAEGLEHHLELTMELPQGVSRITRKRFRLDGRAVRAHDMVGALRAVLFSPEDVELVTGPPSERRRQMDILISQIDRAYMRALTTYAKVLSQRNSLLKRFSRERVDYRSRNAVTELSFWDEELVRSGAYIIAARYRILAALAGLVKSRSGHLITGHDIGMRYLPRLELPEWGEDERQDAEGLQQRVEMQFVEQLRSVRAEEVRRGTTVLGPQRDDFEMVLDGRSLAAYGSRGQQRLGVIALKLSESDIIAERTGERPVILLDDVLSELDREHRSLLLSALSEEGSQLLVTSADLDALDHPALWELPLIRIVDGVIERER